MLEFDCANYVRWNTGPQANLVADLVFWIALLRRHVYIWYFVFT